MKPTKIRNRHLYLAPIHTISKHLRAHMSKDLHEKYGLHNVRVKKGDTIRILRGEYKGIDGKVTKVSSEKSCVAIEGVKKEKLRGEKFDVYIHTSNVIIIDLNTDDRWRKKILEGKKSKFVLKDETHKDKHEKLEPKAEKTDDKVQKKKEKNQLSIKKKTEEKTTKEDKSLQKPPKTKSKQRKDKKLKKTETANG